MIKYEGECIENIEWIGSYKNCIQSKNNCSYLAVTKNIWLNQQNNDWEWLSMKVSASKIWNESNHKKLLSIEKRTTLTLLLRTTFDWIDETMNEGDDVWRWVHQNMEWVESYKHCGMGIKILVRFVCRHDQNPCPWWVFDNIVKILKKWGKILYFEIMRK